MSEHWEDELTEVVAKRLESEGKHKEAERIRKIGQRHKKRSHSKSTGHGIVAHFLVTRRQARKLAKGGAVHALPHHKHAKEGKEKLHEITARLRPEHHKKYMSRHRYYEKHGVMKKMKLGEEVGSEFGGGIFDDIWDSVKSAGRWVANAVSDVTGWLDEVLEDVDFDDPRWKTFKLSLKVVKALTNKLSGLTDERKAEKVRAEIEKKILEAEKRKIQIQKEIEKDEIIKARKLAEKEKLVKQKEAEKKKKLEPKFAPPPPVEKAREKIKEEKVKKVVKKVKEAIKNAKKKKKKTKGKGVKLHEIRHGGV